MLFRSVSQSRYKMNRNYDGLNANVFGVYNVDEKMKYFAGVGKSSRVPDARELYSSTGNSKLDDTKNYEADIGFDKTIGTFKIKPKLFYSELKDYIYNTGSTFQNIDAKIYGLDISGLYALDDHFSFDYRDWETDRKSTRLNSSHSGESRMPSSA